MRTTRIELGGRTLQILGDPHLGRPFVNGVPLHRRGEREASMMADFKASLAKAGEVDFHVCMGDLFDKWYVPYSIVFEAIVAYQQAAHENPLTQFVVLGGNHDVSKDLEKRGALDLFEIALNRVANIKVVRHRCWWMQIGTISAGFFPWHPTIPADELVDCPIDVAFGHWDTVFGHDNMIPTEKLAEHGCKTAYTGHVHLPATFKRDGVEVVVVGSMQPVAHGEDEGEMYITVTPDQLPGHDWSQKCVRVLLQPGEVFDQAVECLHLTLKRVTGNGTVEEIEVSLGDFNMATLFEQAFEEEGVPTAVRAALLSRFEEARVKE